MLLLARYIAILCVLTFIAKIEIAALLTTISTYINFGARDVQIFHIISARDIMLLLLIARTTFLLDYTITHYGLNSRQSPHTQLIVYQLLFTNQRLSDVCGS